MRGLNLLLLKRLEDLVLSILILLAISPAMLVIALIIKITSKGPVLFKQWRYGLNGKPNLVYKFRTMTVFEDGFQFDQVKSSDPRITIVGAFLRRTSLDELPQFINVLQGRMSLVGPRPHPVAMNEMYRKQVPWYMLRHKIKPGITGLAQIKGFRGETDTQEEIEKRIDCDLKYLKQWSLLWILRSCLKLLLMGLGIIKLKKEEEGWIRMGKVSAVPGGGDVSSYYRSPFSRCRRQSRFWRMKSAAGMPG